MDANNIVAVLSAGLSIIGAVTAGVMTTWSNRRTRHYEAVLDSQRRAQSAAEQVDRVLRRYTEPLLQAAHALQSWLYYIIWTPFLANAAAGPLRQRRYARENTVYVLAEYLCWLEIIRREVRFLDWGNEEQGQAFAAHVETTQQALSRSQWGAELRLFLGEQRAVGELLMHRVEDDGGVRHDCLGYAQWSDRLALDERYASWFEGLLADVDALAGAAPVQLARLVHLQHALIDLMDFLDPQRRRLPTPFRERAPLPDGVLPLAAVPEPAVAVAGVVAAVPGVAAAMPG